MEFKKTKRGTCYYKQDIVSIHNGVMYTTSVYTLHKQLPQVQEYHKNTPIFKITLMDRIFNFFDNLFIKYDYNYRYPYQPKDKI